MRSGVLGSSRKRQRPKTSRLDSPARRALQGFVRLLAASGYATQAIQDEVASACRRVPTSFTDSDERRHRGDPGHIMTLWFSDPTFLDPSGYPRPLPLRGSRLPLLAQGATRCGPDAARGQMAAGLGGR